jgi:dolichol kinase
LAQALALDSQRLATELYEVLRELDPSRWRAEVAANLRPRIEKLREQIQALMTRAQAHPSAPAIAAMRERLSELLQLIDEALPRPGLHETALAQRWNDFRVSMTPAYERLASSLASMEVHVPSLRPTNYARNAFHIFNATGCMCLIAWVLTDNTALLLSGCMTVGAWSCELTRRHVPAVNQLVMRLFSLVSHPHEQWRINSATWYSTAMLILAALHDLQAAAVAIGVLGFADPAAAIIGRRFGSIKLINGRTLEGTSTFVVVGVIVAALWMVQVYAFTLNTALVLALCATIPAALAELLSRRIDDNLSIPVAAAIGMVIGRSIIGL